MAKTSVIFMSLHYTSELLYFCCDALCSLSLHFVFCILHCSLHECVCLCAPGRHLPLDYVTYRKCWQWHYRKWRKCCRKYLWIWDQETTDMAQNKKTFAEHYGRIWWTVQKVVNRYVTGVCFCVRVCVCNLGSETTKMDAWCAKILVSFFQLCLFFSAFFFSFNFLVLSLTIHRVFFSSAIVRFFLLNNSVAQNKIEANSGFLQHYQKCQGILFISIHLHKHVYILVIKID